MIVFVQILVMSAALLVLMPSSAQAQQKKKIVGASTPLAPDERPTSMWFGGYVGPTFASQGGTFTTDCNCEFSGGAGTGFAVGLMFEDKTTSKIIIGAQLGYDIRGLTGRFREIEGSTQSSPSGRTYTVPIQFFNQASISLDVLSATAYAKYAFLGPVYARAGINAGYVVGSSLVHTKTLETKTVTFPNGEVASVVLPDAPGGIVTVQSGPVGELNPLQLGLVCAFGVEIPIRKVERKFAPPAVTTYLSPVIQYQFPISNISAQGNSFQLRQMQFFLELRHNL
ncbi:MAG: hypothetical protein ACK5GI_06300 [Ignavibacteria bacterium]|jgi:hypothetical protein